MASGERPPVQDARLGPARAPSSGDQQQQQEIFVLPRQRSRQRRESRMFLVDGQLCWADEPQSSLGSQGNKRHSSMGLLFGSSMDLSGMSMGHSIDSSGGAGSGSDEAISYRIKWCRENILQLKRQTWPMEKKLQVLKASKLFIKQHQGDLKQSKQASDVLASSGAILDRYWRHFKREFANFLVIITPWEMRIKKIESHFGSVVASYFTFLRWIFWLNLANSLVMVAFVMVPELIENVPDPTGMRKGDLGMQQPVGADGQPAPPPDFNPTLGEMWEFEGFLKFSPIFYGYYSNIELSKSGFWRNPLAFLLSAMLTYLFCFICISRKLSQNTKLSRIGSKDDEYTFCWTVFVGWDFMIGNSETAYNKTSSLVMNLKEGILEEKEQTKDRDWRLIIRRVMANVLTLMLIVASAYVVTLAVQRSENLPEDASLLQKNELQLVMSGIQFMFPPLFDVIGIIEKYHPRKALSWQLGRILFLDFLNFYTLMFSLFGTVDQMGNQLNEVSGNITLLRKNTTYWSSLFTTTTTTTTTTTLATTTTAGSATTESALMTTTSILATINGSTLADDLMLTSSNNNSMGSRTQVESSTPTGIEMTTTTELASTLAASTSFVLSATSTTMLPFSPDLPASTTTSASAPTLTATAGSEPDDEVGKPASSTSPSTLSAPTEGASQQTSSSSSSTMRTNSEDEDYFDLGEALRQGNKAPGLRRRRRRQASGLGRRMSDDGPVEGGGSLITPLPAPRASGQPRRPFKAPIQDPYRRLSWPAANEPEPGNQEDEEEPLEGRMSAGPSRASSSASSSSSTTTTRRTLVARPLGGSTRRPRPQLQSSWGPGKAPSLDDDASEEGEEEEEMVPTSPPAPVGSGPVAASSSAVATSRALDDGQVEPTTAAHDDSAATRLIAATSAATSDGPLSRSELVPAAAVAAAAAEATTEPSSSGCPMGEVVATGQPNGSWPRPGWSSSRSGQLGFNASEVSYTDCLEIPEFRHEEIIRLNETFREKLKSLCWETMFGQEMVKIVVMDLVMTVISAVSFEFMRACFVRYCNRFFFWDLERGFPGYQDFKIAENVLHLVNNQSTVWMGMFFAPGLPAINTVKLAVLMYVRSWAVLTCNIPHETVFKVSKSNNFYYWILLINLLICILPVAYAVTWIRPSWHCGPFAGECRMYIVMTKLAKQLLPPEASVVFKYLSSAGAVIPMLISLVLIIYYLASTVSSSKEANKELKAQLKKDKEQEAAVPEITSTTVADAAPAAGAPPEPQEAGARSLLMPPAP